MTHDGSTNIGCDGHENELVIIDSSIGGEDVTLPGVAAATEILTLLPGKDPVAQIARALTARFGIKRLHIICESSVDALGLSGFRVDEAYLNTRGNAFSSIGFSFAASPEVLVWTNGLAASSDNQRFVASLSDAFGARVTVNPHVIGNSGDTPDPFVWAAEAA